MIKKILLLLFMFIPLKAYSFEANISAGTGLLYLRIGDGGFNGSYYYNGTPLNLATINTASTSLTSADLLSSSPVGKLMITNGTINRSHYDSYLFCNIPEELYVGGFYRRPNNYSNRGSATLVATVPNGLTNETGQVIPFNRISYASSGNSEQPGDFQPFASKTFNSGSMSIGNIPVNKWSESCHKFTYNHTGFLASGVYRARVIYTLTSP